MRRQHRSAAAASSTKMNSLASFLLLLLFAATSSRTRIVVEAVGTPPAHVSGGGAAAEGAAATATATAAAGSSTDAAAAQFFDVDDALAAIRAQAAAGSDGNSAPLSPAAAATAGRTAMDNACGPGLGRCTLTMGGCCSERGTCGWACRGACQGLYSAPGFCETGAVEGTSGTSVSAALPPAASSLPVASLGSPCGAYLARCAGGEKGEGAAGSCCSVLGFCVRAPSPLCSGDGSEDDDGGSAILRRRRTTRRFRLVATRGEANTSAEGSSRPQSVLVNGRGPPLPPLSLSVAAGDRVVVEFVDALDEPSGLHFHGVRWRDRANEDGAAGVAQRAVAAGGADEEGGGDGKGGTGGSSLLPPVPPVFVYDFVARDPGTYWWHSHVRVQAADGLRGTLVVRGGEEEKGLSRRRRRRQPESTLFVADWYGAPSALALGAYLSERNANGREPTPDALTLNGRSWWWRQRRGGGVGSGGGGGGGGGSSPASSSPSPSSSSLPPPPPPPPPPSVEVSDPQGDSRALAPCSEPRDMHSLIRVVNGGTFATVAVSFVAAVEAQEEEVVGATSSSSAAAAAAATTAAKTKPKPPRLRATIVAADAVPTAPTVLDPSRPLRLGVGQRHDVELCVLESDGEESDEEGGSSGSSGSSDSGGRKEKKNNNITSVWAVAVADGALFDAPMRLSNVTAAVLRFGGGGGGGGGGAKGRDARFLLPPEGVDLSDAGASAAAPPAFFSAIPSSSSVSSPALPPIVPSPEPTVFHQLTISFNKQQNRSVFVHNNKDDDASGGDRQQQGGPSYFVEGFSQRPRGLDDPGRPSLLEAERERAMRLSSSSSSSPSGAAVAGGGKEGHEELQDKEWNLLRHPLGAVVEMLVRNADDVEHSWHLHGHNFWVVNAEEDGGERGEDGGGKGLKSTAVVAEARDTVLIPAGTAVRLRYVADSPGAFLAHCHMGWHEAAGLAAVMVDGVE